MKNQTAVAVAIALVVSSVGVAIAPSALAGHKNCHKDFDINDTSQTRDLDENEREIGLSEVSAPLDEVLNVTLETDDDKMEFTIREKVGNSCEDPDDLSSDCQGTLTLDTEGTATTDWKECTLPAPDTGTREFYVAFVNIGNSTLDYSVVSD